MKSTDSGDRPDQHLLDLTSRLTPSPAVVRQILRQLGVPEPDVAAKILKNSGLSLAPHDRGKTPKQVLQPQKIVRSEKATEGREPNAVPEPVPLMGSTTEPKVLSAPPTTSSRTTYEAGFYSAEPKRYFYFSLRREVDGAPVRHPAASVAMWCLERVIHVAGMFVLTALFLPAVVPLDLPTPPAQLAPGPPAAATPQPNAAPTQKPTAGNKRPKGFLRTLDEDGFLPAVDGLLGIGPGSKP